MWTIVFIILLFIPDKRIILTTFLIAGIVQGIESYFDYKVKLGYQEVLVKSTFNVNDLIKHLSLSQPEDMSIYNLDIEEGQN